MNFVKRISELKMFEDESKLNGVGESLMIDRGPQDYTWINGSELTDSPMTPCQSISILYIVIYIVLLGSMQFIAKALMQVYSASPFEILIFRSGIELLLSFVYFWYYELSIFDVESTKAQKLLSSSLIGFLALTAHFVALQNLPIGMTLALGYLSYHFAQFFDSLLFSYVMRSFQILGYVTAFIGVLMLVYGKGSTRHIIGIILGLIGSLLFGLHSILVRQIVTTVEPMLCFTYINLATACFVTVLEFINYDNSIPNYTVFMWLLLLLVGVMGWGSNYVLTVIIQHERSVLRSYMFRYLIVVIASLFSIYLGELTVVSICGIGLIGVQFVVSMIN